MALRQLEAGLEIALVGRNGRGQCRRTARTGCRAVGGDPAAEGVDARIGDGLAGHRRVSLFGLRELAGFEQEFHVVEARAVVGRVDGHRLLQLGQRGFGIAFGDQRLGLVELGLGFELIRARHMFVEEGADLCFGQRADETVDGLAAEEHHAEGDRAHAEGLAQLAGDFGLLVAVQLGQLEAPGIGHLELFQHGAELFAGAAPGCPDVEQHRLLHRPVDEVGLEIGERDVLHGGL